MGAALVGLLLVWIFLLVIVLREGRPFRFKKVNLVRFMSRVAIFGALSAILYIVPFLKFPLPFFPQFLEFHFDEIPVFIAGFAYGPFSAFCALIVKTIIKLPFTSTLTVGEWADLIYSTAFIVPAAFIYQKRRNIKGVIIGFAFGFIVQIATSLVFNVYIMIPFYMLVMGFPEAAILAMAQAANPSVTNIGWSLGFLAIVPFNVLKNVMVIILTFLVYKSIHRFIAQFEEKKLPS
ncbi:MAG: ECF transporter S component [Erysipelotrichia bacterium]|jgi:riboflavin transporter FmnP|nr:ECF transporter S component [Erysipelotrichia bacterium]